MKRTVFLSLLLFVITAVMAQNIDYIPVDLGLSVKWCGIDLCDSNGQTLYFQWGETQGYKRFNRNWKQSDYLPAKEVNLKSGDMAYIFRFKEQLLKRCDENYILKKEYDAANILLQGKWRMPTTEEWKELLEKCTLVWEVHNSKGYLRVTGPNGNYIYLIANGWYSLYPSVEFEINKGTMCCYWSGDIKGSSVHNNNYIAIFVASRYKNQLQASLQDTDCPADGRPIRPVYDDRMPQPKPVVVTKNVPTFAWATVPATTTLSSVKISVGIQSKSHITSTHVYVNGQLYRGIKAVSNDGADMRIEQTLPLTEGSNIIKVSATNADGTATTERTIVRQGVKPVVVTQSKRIALVIGNANYPEQRLVNPQNDATDMAAKLKSLGFEVILLQDGTKKQVEDAINTLGQRARGYDVAMFYYAGHGIQYKGANYLIPVNANLRSASDIEYECTDMGRVLSKLDESGCKMKIIALDACRNNPFERSWYRGTASQGLTAVNAPVGTFISYATSPGSVAADGQTRNSPYTTALLKTLDTPGLTIESVFKRVAASVFSATNHQQMPWYASSLFQGDFIFNNQK